MDKDSGVNTGRQRGCKISGRNSPLQVPSNCPSVPSDHSLSAAPVQGRKFARFREEHDVPVGSFLALPYQISTTCTDHVPSLEAIEKGGCKLPGREELAKAATLLGCATCGEHFLAPAAPISLPQKMSGLGLLLFEDFTVAEPSAEGDLKTSDLLNGTESNAGSASRGLHPASLRTASASFPSSSRAQLFGGH